MHGSISKFAVTDPLVEGGSYEYWANDEFVESGTVNGTSINRTTGQKEGLLYTKSRGSMPIFVVENTESLSHWRLVAAPSKTAATHMIKAHREKSEAAEDAKQKRLNRTV